MKKVKKYIWFVLVSCLCSFITGHKQQTASGKTTFRFGFPLANAKLCPKGTEFLDADGDCCAGSFNRHTGLCNDGTCGKGKFWNIKQDTCLSCNVVSPGSRGYFLWSGIAPKDCKKCGYKVYGSYCLNDDCDSDQFWDSQVENCIPCKAANPNVSGSYSSPVSPANYPLTRISESDCKKCGLHPEKGYCLSQPCSSVAWTHGMDDACRLCGYDVKGSYCVPKDVCKADEFWSTSGGCTSCSGFNARPIGFDYGMMTSGDCKKCGLIEENGFCVRTRGYTACSNGYETFIYPQGCSVPQLNMRGYAIGSEISEAGCFKVGGYVAGGYCYAKPSCNEDQFWSIRDKVCAPASRIVERGQIVNIAEPGYAIGTEITEADCLKVGGYVKYNHCYPTPNCGTDKFWSMLFSQCTPASNITEKGRAIGTEITEADCLKVGGYVTGGYCVKNLTAPALGTPAPAGYVAVGDSSGRCGRDSFWDLSRDGCYPFYPDKRGYIIGQEISQSDCVRLNGYVADGYCVKA